MSTCHSNLSPSNDRRAGYTLLEMLLVLGILLVLAGIAWPGFSQMYRRHQLLSGAEAVRGTLAAGRLRAIDTGAVYEFVYETGGRQYHLLPFEAGDAAPGALPMRSGELPEPLRFGRGEGEPLPVLPSALAAELLPAAGTSSAWSTPILFAPDGTATEASVEVIDADGQYVRLSVRGLTGAVSVGGILQGAAP